MLSHEALFFGIDGCVRILNFLPLNVFYSDDTHLVMNCSHQGRVRTSAGGIPPGLTTGIDPIPPHAVVTHRGGGEQAILRDECQIGQAAQAGGDFQQLRRLCFFFMPREELLDNFALNDDAGDDASSSATLGRGDGGQESKKTVNRTQLLTKRPRSTTTVTAKSATGRR